MVRSPWFAARSGPAWIRKQDKMGARRQGPTAQSDRRLGGPPRGRGGWGPQKGSYPLSAGTGVGKDTPFQEVVNGPPVGELLLQPADAGPAWESPRAGAVYRGAGGDEKGLRHWPSPQSFPCT